MAAQVVKHFQKPWQILVSVCLTRLNVISKDLVDIEKRYASLQSELELEQAVLNDYEIQKRELSIQDARKNTNLSEKEESEVLEASRELATIQDQEEIWANDFKKINITDRSSASDQDLTSSYRQLDEIVHYLVKDETMLQKQSLVYPYTTIQNNENLKKASLRLLDSHGLAAPNVVFYSNAPVGVLKIRYKEEEERGNIYQGAKVFFTKATINARSEVVQEVASSGPLLPERQWLSIAEFEQSSNSEYVNRVKHFVQ